MYSTQIGANLDDIFKEKVFPEPRLLIFVDEGHPEKATGCLVVEKNVMYKILEFSVIEGIISLIAGYYTLFVSYPASSPAKCFLLFVQEILLGKKEAGKKRPSKYNELLNRIL